jgi:hypothetical protein
VEPVCWPTDHVCHVTLCFRFLQQASSDHGARSRSASAAKRSPPSESSLGTCRKCFSSLNDTTDQLYARLHSASSECNAVFCADCWVNHILGYVSKGAVPRECPLPRTAKCCDLSRSNVNSVLTQLEKASVITTSSRGRHDTLGSSVEAKGTSHGRSSSTPGTKRFAGPESSSLLATTPSSPAGHSGLARKVKCPSCVCWMTAGKVEQVKGYV